VGIDYIEETAGEISAYEFKWKNSGVKAGKIPKGFSDNNKYSGFKIVDKNNYRDFLR